MNNFQLLLDSIVKLAAAGGVLVQAAGQLFTANLIPILWIFFFLFVVRWSDLREQLRKGAWVPLTMLYLLVSVTWGVCSKQIYPAVFTSAAPLGGMLEKGAIGLFWVMVAFVCGYVQDLWGWGPPFMDIAGPPEQAVKADGHGGHGHGGHHDDHGHAGHH